MAEAHTYFSPRYGPRDRGLRAADSDRETVAEILREQHVAGRLNTDELQERLGRCYSARSYGDLDALVADLPREEPRPSGSRRWGRRPMAALVVLLLAAAVLSHGHLAWLAIPTFFLVTRTLLWRGSGGRYAWGGFGCATRHDTYV